MAAAGNPAAIVAAATPPAQRVRAKPSSPPMSPDRKYQRVAMSMTLKDAIGGLDKAIGAQDHQEFILSAQKCFHAVMDQLAAWETTICEQASGLEGHHRSLYNAKVSVDKIVAHANNLQLETATSKSKIEDMQNELNMINGSLFTMERQAEGKEQVASSALQAFSLELNGLHQKLDGLDQRLSTDLHSMKQQI